MKIVFIYGPPGVGKLTVGKELAKITGYKLFHNHLSVDLVLSVFPFGSKTSVKLNKKIRYDMIDASAKEGVSIIMTFVYAKVDDSFVKGILKIAKRRKAEVVFVKLFCKHKELHKRVRHDSRKPYMKIKKVKTLKALMKEHDVELTIPFGESLIIDNTRLPPKRCAEIIKKHYKLTRS